MSAYIVDPELISEIASFAHYSKCCHYGLTYQKGLDEIVEIVKTLCQQNIESIKLRYPDTEGDEVNNFIPSIKSNTDYIVMAIQGAKRIRNANHKSLSDKLSEYSYQACETDDYFDSLAFKIVTQCREQILKEAFPR